MSTPFNAKVAPALVYTILLLLLSLINVSLFASKCSTFQFARLVTEKEANVQPVTRSNADRLSYHEAPDVLVKEISDCIFDQRYCHVLYWHVQKTGGSYISSKLYPAFNRESYHSKEWCCNDKFMKQAFWPNTSMYCAKRMGVYEVRPEDYKKVLQECTNLARVGPKSTKQHRYIGMISIREPIQRTHSGIHQRCNVHTSKLDNKTHDICERCTYDGDDKGFYEKIVNDTNLVYKGMQGILSDPEIDIPLYVIDNDDIDAFFTQLEESIAHHLNRAGLSLPNGTFQFPSGNANAEAKQKLCNFGMPSSLMKQHQPALQAYHWFWSGAFRTLAGQ